MDALPVSGAVRSKGMDTTIIHLSDFHIGSWMEYPPAEAARNNLKFIVQSLVDNFDVSPMPVIIITGDFVNDGTAKQFREARHILKPLYQAGFIVLPVPGNHDYGAGGNHIEKKRLGRFKEIFFGMSNPHFPLENVTYPFTKKINGHYFIGLNSVHAEAPNDHRWLNNGELGIRQRAKLNGILNQLDARSDELKMKEKVIVYLHHHPFIFPHDERRLAAKKHDQIANYLTDGDELMELIAGRVDILLFGHNHEHVNFSTTFLTGEKEFDIPIILCCGKSTVDCKELFIDYGGNVTGESTDENLLGWRMDIDEQGQMIVEAMVF